MKNGMLAKKKKNFLNFFSKQIVSLKFMDQRCLKRQYKIAEQDRFLLPKQLLLARI